MNRFRLLFWCSLSMMMFTLSSKVKKTVKAEVSHDPYVPFDKLSKKQQAVFQEMQNLQNILSQNLFNLAMDQRKIDQWTTPADKKAAQKRIDTFCTSIEEGIKQHQKKIIQKIEALD